MTNRLTVKVIGCGGVGLCLLNVLPRFLSYQSGYDQVDLGLIDGDNYEQSNRARQNFTNLGNKAEVTAGNIRREFPNLFCYPTSDYLTENNIEFLIREGDVVFSCVDNHATRKLISDHCEKLENVTFISGGNEYTDGNIQVHVRKDGVNCTKPIASYKKEISKPADKNPGDAKRRESGGCEAERVSSPQLLITNNFIAALMLNAFYSWMQNKFASKETKYDEAYGDVLLNKVAPKQR